MKETVRDYWRLVRGENLVFIVILMWAMTYWVARSLMAMHSFSDLMPDWLWLLLTLAAVLIAAGGYVVNDYFDIKIDRINRPDRLVVTRTVSKNTAMRLFYCLTAAGVVAGMSAAWVLRSPRLGIIFAITPGLLWFYSASYKRMLIVGNVIVAFLSSLLPLLVAIAQTAWLTRLYGEEMMRYMPVGRHLFVWLGGFALFAFLCSWVREVVKDLQDQNGDRELECHTMPIVWGNIWSKVFATTLIAIIAALIAWLHWGHRMPFPTTWHSPATRYIVFGLYVPLACEIALLWSAKIDTDYRSAQGLMKFIMFLGTMFSYVVFRLL
ncbi:MAG: geranylgeranylglycerol-phosphate geranylgeranyltransferase [Paludibacteraceae bacterium]|nr:geranylgeranylglycerol-phosphate geranylgeranyltransferase [Paludibacteraceae bacterium]